MAIELRFLDAVSDGERYLKVKSESDFILIDSINKFTGSINTVALDKSTAIRFAKTIRTEIAKIKDSE